MENPKSQELQQLILNKESGYNYRKRRQEDWLTNYTLYRDRIKINRLTQRQSLNVPLMKQTIRTLLKDVDDMPVLYFENLDNEKQKEVFFNQYWEETMRLNKMDLKDIVDKRQVFLFGRSFDSMQVVDGRIVMSIEDPQDMLIDRYVDPTDIDTAHFLIHTHIYKPLAVLEKNPIYDKEALADLRKWYMSTQGLIKVAENSTMSTEKNRKMEDMGVEDVADPILGEAIIELNLHFVYDTKKGADYEELFLKVEAENEVILLNKPLEEVIGETQDHYWRTHFPYNTWADDVERQDFWSDGVADIVRPSNIILNSWISQLAENRTLRNFGMHYYNSNLEGFNPQTFNPVPWGWYPIPLGQGENINNVLQKVDIPDLSEALDEMQFVIGISERATGATATQQGAQIERQVTLGEVQLALGEAKERVKGMSKFYTPAWKARGEKFCKLVEASQDKLDAVKIYKKGLNTDNIFGREISPKDYVAVSGYNTKVWSQEDKATQDTKSLEKLNAVKMNMPDNQKLTEIYQRKLLEFADLTPTEVNEVMEAEKKKQEMLAMQAQAQNMPMQPQGMPQLPMPAPTPVPVVPPAPKKEQ